MTKRKTGERFIEHEKRILEAQQNLEKILKRIEPFKVKKENISPPTTGKWCKATSLCG